MPHQYSEHIAAHYAAYRPPLHELILQRVFAEEAGFSDGLDVGCGTGRSSVALAEYCERVFAVDPSESMLESAMPRDGITYLPGSAEKIPLPDGTIDVATFAGSLSYANLNETVAELRRVCRDRARVVPYDFEVLIDKVLEPFDIAANAPDGDYDHRANFSSVPEFHESLCKHERILFEVQPAELAHILLADAARYDAFVSRYETNTPHQDLLEELGRDTRSVAIEADLYYSVYRVVR